MREKTKGFAPIIILVIILIFGTIAGTYYLIKKENSLNSIIQTGIPTSSYSSYDNISGSKIAPGDITDPNNPIVLDSRKAIIATGFSENYFNTHMSLEKAYDPLKQVIWLYTVGEWKSEIIDSAASEEMDRNGNVTSYTHSVTNDYIKGVHDITNLLSKAQATNLMQVCLAKYNRQISQFENLTGAFNAGPKAPFRDPNAPYNWYLTGRHFVKGVHLGGPSGPDQALFDYISINLQTGECQTDFASQ